MATASVTLYQGFMVQRYLSSDNFFPVQSTPNKLNHRLFLGFCEAAIASAFSLSSLRPWQYQYLILGAVTVVWGLGMIRFLPDNSIQARFLSDRDRILTIERMRPGQTGIEISHFKLYQAKEALLDIKTWLMMLMVFCTHLVNAAVTGFGSIIVSGFGFSPVASLEARLLRWRWSGISATSVALV